MIKPSYTVFVFAVFILILMPFDNLFGQKRDTALTKIKDNTGQLNEVVVTAQFGPQSVKNAVYNVRTLNAEKIKLRGATSVQQVLSTELGFRFSNDLTLGTSDIELLGMSGRNIKILLDGVPMVDRSDTRESLNQIDINRVERIEIVEGPVSVVYGTDALAGVINIITKKTGMGLLTISARVQEETVGSEYGALTGNGHHHQHVSLSWHKKGWNALVGASHNDFGGWNLPLNTATRDEVNAITNQWKPKEQFLANTKFGYWSTNFSIFYRLDGLKEEIDSKGGINPNYTRESQTYLTDRYTQQLQSELRISDRLQVNAIVGYTNLQRGTRTLIYDFRTNTDQLSTAAGKQDTAKFNAAIFRTTAQYTFNKAIAIQPGFELNRDAASGQRIKGTPVIYDYAFFVSAELRPIENLNIRPGIRFIRNTVYDAPAAIPSLNTMLRLSKRLDLRLSYARGFRAPALRELYFDFFDASHSIMGNENLKAEQSNNFTGSLAWGGVKRDGLQFKSTLSSYYNLLTNQIEYGQDPVDPTLTTLINISRTKTFGGTLENTMIMDGFQASLGFSYIGRYNRLSESESGFELPEFVWTPEVNTNLSYAFSKIKANINLFYKYTGARPSFQITTENGIQTARQVKVGAFNLADLMFNKNLLHNITLNVGVKNLLDVTQLTNSATASEGAHSSGGGSVPYSYGRSYVLGLSYNWSKL